MREEIFECILSRNNDKPSLVSSDVVAVLNSESNQKEVLKKINGDSS